MNKNVLMGANYVAPSIDLTDGLIAHYPLNNDSTINDWTTNYDGTEEGTLVFDDVSYVTDGGVTNDLQVNSLAPIIDTFTEISLSVWTSFNSTASSQTIFSFNDGTLVNTLILTYDTSPTPHRLTVRGRLDGTYYIDGGFNFDPTLGQKYHIAVTSDSNGMKIFLDGVEQTLVFLYGDSTTPILQDYPSLLNTSYIGCLNYGTDLYSHNGTISNLRIYNKVLQQNEITELYNEGLVPNLPDVTTNLINYHPLSGTADDFVGGDNGTENSLTYENDSVRGSVPYFNGTSSYVQLPTLIDPQTKFTMTYWINCNSLSAVNKPFVTYDSAVSSSNQNTCMAVGTAGFNASLVNEGELGLIPNLDQWYFVTQTFDGVSSCKSYIDAVFYLEGVGIPDAMVGNNLWYFGAKIANGNYFDGRISNFRLYNEVLTQTEIETIYKTERVQHNIGIDDGLIAYYPLEQNSNDNNYNQYDGTDQNVTYDGISANFVQSSSSGIMLNAGILDRAQSHSMCLWFKTLTDVSTHAYQWAISEHNDGTGSFVFLLNSTNGQLDVYVYDGLSSVVNTGVKPTINQWYHVAITYDSSSFKSVVYLDGVNMGEVISQQITTIGEFTLGNHYDMNTYNANDGSIANARIYSRALSDGDINTIYNKEKSKFGL